MLLTFLDIAVSLVNKDGGVWTLFSQIFRTMPTAYAEGWERENVSTIRAVKYLVIGTCPRVFTVGMAQRCVVVCVQKSRRQPSVPMSFHGCVTAKIFFEKQICTCAQACVGPLGTCHTRLESSVVAAAHFPPSSGRITAMCLPCRR